MTNHPVLCASCGRRIAWATSQEPLRTQVTCSQWCLMELPVTPTEARTDQWAALHKAGGWSPVAIAKLYGVPHSQVYKALDRIGARH